MSTAKKLEICHRNNMITSFLKIGVHSVEFGNFFQPKSQKETKIHHVALTRQLHVYTLLDSSNGVKVPWAESRRPIFALTNLRTSSAVALGSNSMA